MCGIFGYILKDYSFPELEKLNLSLIDSLKHRGPDDNGIFTDGKVAIANTRLSIIDVEHGHQPVFNDKQNIIVVQNGEIYNFIEVRDRLKVLGMTFNTSSDTEVILRAYEYWGETFVNELNGMFAIAIFDRDKDLLFIYRDRLGVKPLYIYENGNELVFSSEIKSFTTLPSFDNAISKQAICDYLVLNYIPLPNTIFQKVRHLPPAHYMKVSTSSGELELKKYWHLDSFKENHNFNQEELENSIEDLFLDAVRIRLRSDVEVGAFLSGGLDSSMVTAFMRKLQPESKIATYSIGFKEKSFDESEYAKSVNAKYKLDEHIKILEGDIIKYWESTTYYNDQPHGDISFIPTYILSEFAAKDLKVVLTGDGGDELFAGYLKYQELETNQDIQSYFRNSSVFSPELLETVLKDSFKAEVDLNHAELLFNNTLNEVRDKDLVNQVLYFEAKQLLPGNNLVKPDKMAMANSLETRSPFLDYRLFELISTIPSSLKLSNGDTKHILKKISLKYFDHDHVYRKKQMFTVPVGEWFKDKLSGYLMGIINSDEIRNRGIWNHQVLDELAKDHISGKANYTRQLRAIVNLELWFRIFIDKKHDD